MKTKSNYSFAIRTLNLCLWCSATIGGFAADTKTTLPLPASVRQEWKEAVRAAEKRLQKQSSDDHSWCGWVPANTAFVEESEQLRREREIVSIPAPRARLEIASFRGVRPSTTNGLFNAVFASETARMRRASIHFGSALHTPLLGVRTGSSLFAARRHADGRLTDVRVVEDGLGCLRNTLAEEALNAEPWPRLGEELFQATGTNSYEVIIRCVVE